MNKKGSILPLMAMIIFPIIAIGIASGIVELQEVNKGCEDIGYSKYEYKQDFQFCEDESGNLHYIKYECEYMIGLVDLFAESCNVSKIKVGEVYHDSFGEKDE